jgi:hypothetical protein
MHRAVLFLSQLQSNRTARGKCTSTAACAHVLTHFLLVSQSKHKYAGKIMKKKTKAEKESSPFNVFMKTELMRLKQVTRSRLTFSAVCPLFVLFEAV